MRLPEIERVWIFDFDGTLSDIVSDRDAAVLNPLCRTVLLGLVGQRGQTVAVLSSRRLDDLALRADVPGLYLGGCSGIIWLTPDGKKHSCEHTFSKQLTAVRAAVLDRLKTAGRHPGVELEDKQWSLTVHVRNAADDVRQYIHEQLENIAAAHAIRLFRGPKAIEVQLIPAINKAFGVREFCEGVLGISGHTAVIYAGDDENDATAMRWVLDRGGVALTVGSAPLVPGAQVVATPLDLALAVCALYKNRNICGHAEAAEHNQGLR